MEEDFTFKNIQIIQHFEEKVNEVFPVLEANIDILTELKEHYHGIVNSEDCPKDLKSGCRKEYGHFDKQINNIITDLQRHLSRIRMLQTLFKDRKDFVSGFEAFRVRTKFTDDFSSTGS